MSHGHIMYTAKMCHNWVLGDFIIFILGCSIANIWNWCTCSAQSPCDVTHLK